MCRSTFFCFEIRFAALLMSLLAVGFTDSLGAEPPADSVRIPSALDLERWESGLPESPPTDVHFELPTTVLAWDPIATTLFVAGARTRWKVTEEVTQPAIAVVDGVSRPLRQTRVVLSPTGEDPPFPPVAVQHLGNETIAFLSLSDPRASAPPTASEDPADPWPANCTVSLVTLERSLDLNRNQRNELALLCRSPADLPGAEQLLLIEPGEDGVPRLVPLAEILTRVRSDDLSLTGISWVRAVPTLHGKHLGLEGCRFLVQMGLRGRTECPDCCRFPLVFGRDPDGTYRPAYDRGTQRIYFERLRSDLKALGAGGEEDPMVSEQAAALCRAAAFFYLTGTSSETREQLLRALGPKANHFRARILIDRLERYFLLEPDTPSLPDSPPAPSER